MSAVPLKLKMQLMVPKDSNEDTVHFKTSNRAIEDDCFSRASSNNSSYENRKEMPLLVENLHLNKSVSPAARRIID